MFRILRKFKEVTRLKPSDLGEGENLGDEAREDNGIWL